MTWTLTSRRVPVIPVGSPMPSWSSTTNSWGSTWRISRSTGMETALAASMTRATSSRSMTRFLLGDGDDAPGVEAADVGAGEADVGGADLDAGHELRLLHHPLDGVDGGLEVDDDALAQALGLSAWPMPMTSSRPSSVISATIAQTLCVPMSSPTT